MFHPSRACSTRPFQVFSFICSRNHSATPCFIRRTSTVVALTPSMTAGSSVANSAIPARDSFFSSFSALKVSRPDRSMSSQTTAANRGVPGWRPRRAGRPGRRRGAGPRRRTPATPAPGRGPPGPGRRTRRPSSRRRGTSRRGSQARAARSCRDSEARGSCISTVEVRPRNATGTGSPGPASRAPAAEATSLRGACLCWRCHWSTSMITAACRASINCARFPVAMRILNRTLIPPGRSPSGTL